MVSQAEKRRNEEDNLDSNSTIKSKNFIPKPEAAFECDRVGRFSHPNSCEKYYFCWDTIHDYEVFKCPHHKAFDPKTQRCVHNFAACAAAPKCQNDRQLLPNPFDKSSYFQCSLISSDERANIYYSDIEYRLYKKICARRGEFDVELGYCKLTVEMEDDSEEDNGKSNKVECTEAGIFIDHTDDSRYYECIAKSVSYARIHQTCPRDHVFSMADKRCIKLDTVEK